MLRDGVAGQQNEQQADYTLEIHTAGRHLLSLINEILDLSKIEAGKMDIVHEVIYARQLCENAMSIVRERAALGRVALSTQLDESLVEFWSDARRIRQILYNLLSNAVKFTPEGGSVTLKVNRSTIDDRDWVVFVVEDTGIGIAETDREKVFAPFEQIDGAIARRYEGTGLGLALVLRLTTLLGGDVVMDSEVGRGSRFEVRLPWGEQRPEVASAARYGPASVVRPGTPLVLLIEDDETMAERLSSNLTDAGYEVKRASSAEEGFERLAETRPDLIVLDLLLGGSDGWEVLARVKGDPKTESVPVVIVSIIGDESRERGFSMGALDVLQKPISANKLLVMLEQLNIHPAQNGTIRVLVVDDDPRAVEVVALPLEAKGYTVVRAHGGKDAIAIARIDRPDLLILDLMMPEVTGFDVIDAFRGDAALADVPIIVVTAKSLSTDDREYLNRNIQGLQQKRAFDAGAFMREVRNLSSSTVTEEGEE